MSASSRQAVWITGIGAITPFALGWADVFNEINRGSPPYGAWSAELSRPFASARLGLIKSVPKERYFDERQLRLMDRAMTLASVTAALAMEDAGILVDDQVQGGDDVATILASAMAEAPSLYRFGIPLLKQPTGTLNPAHFPMIARNIACGQISIRFGLRGWSTMIAAGDASGSHALARAAELVALGRASTVLVGAYEILAQFSLHQLKARWRKHGVESGLAGCDSNHHVPVEGACFFLLESASQASARGKAPYAAISHATQGYRVDPDDTSWDPVLERHLRKSPSPLSAEAALHVRGANPCGIEPAKERDFAQAVTNRFGSSQSVDARADFGDAGAVTAMYQAAVAAQLLKDSQDNRASQSPVRRYAPAKSAVLSCMTNSGAFSLASLQAA